MARSHLLKALKPARVSGRHGADDNGPDDHGHHGRGHARRGASNSGTRTQTRSHG